MGVTISSRLFLFFFNNSQCLSKYFFYLRPSMERKENKTKKSLLTEKENRKEKIFLNCGQSVETVSDLSKVPAL